MSLLVLPRELQQHMAAQAAEAYPRECCGVLIGSRDGERKVVTEVAPVPNVQPEAIRDYFEMDPKVLSAVEDRAAKTGGVEVLGYYHSHPDHPARPSPRDLEAAREIYLFARIRYSYLILACQGGKVVETTSSVLAAGEQAFAAEEIAWTDGPAG